MTKAGEPIPIIFQKKLMKIGQNETNKKSWVNYESIST